MAFWEPFIAVKDGPIVVFSNAEFVGNPSAGLGMHYFNPKHQASDLPTTEDYALLTLMPAFANQWGLVLAGATTFGTQPDFE